MTKQGTVKQLKAYKEKTGFSNARLAAEIGVHKLTLTLWLEGKFKPSNMAERLVENYLAGRTK
ncbi:MAG: hypothetical protein A2V67_12635 [Deltaproteobacteria bacterium RBG_13_61_14]|nr:MAG: hypothetical protein A2V67_12635 [Deltaproteobacteria bacterium RBG_13_61_14]